MIFACSLACLFWLMLACLMGFGVELNESILGVGNPMDKPAPEGCMVCYVFEMVYRKDGRMMCMAMHIDDMAPVDINLGQNKRALPEQNWNLCSCLEL